MTVLRSINYCYVAADSGPLHNKTLIVFVIVDRSPFTSNRFKKEKKTKPIMLFPRRCVVGSKRDHGGTIRQNTNLIKPTLRTRKRVNVRIIECPLVNSSCSCSFDGRECIANAFIVRSSTYDSKIVRGSEKIVIFSLNMTKNNV